VKRPDGRYEIPNSSPKTSRRIARQAPGAGRERDGGFVVIAAGILGTNELCCGRSAKNTVPTLARWSGFGFRPTRLHRVYGQDKGTGEPDSRPIQTSFGHFNMTADEPSRIASTLAIPDSTPGGPGVPLLSPLSLESGYPSSGRSPKGGTISCSSFLR